MFKLGQKVVIEGRLEKVYQDAESAVLQGATAITKKHEVKEFDEPREGIIVGKRNYVELLEHSPAIQSGDVVCVTKPKVRKTAYLVACDMRGLNKVPVSHIQTIDEFFEGYDVEFEDDFEFEL